MEARRELAGLAKGFSSEMQFENGAVAMVVSNCFAGTTQAVPRSVITNDREVMRIVELQNVALSHSQTNTLSRVRLYSATCVVN